MYRLPHQLVQRKVAQVKCPLVNTYNLVAGRKLCIDGFVMERDNTLSLCRGGGIRCLEALLRRAQLPAIDITSDQQP